MPKTHTHEIITRYNERSAQIEEEYQKEYDRIAGQPNILPEGINLSLELLAIDTANKHAANFRTALALIERQPSPDLRKFLAHVFSEETGEGGSDISHVVKDLLQKAEKENGQPLA